MKHLKALCMLMLAATAAIAQPVQQWSMVYTIDSVSQETTNDMAIDAQGYIYQLINTEIYPAGGGVLSKQVIRKVNPAGTVVWSTIYNNNGADNITFRSLAIDDAGSVYVAGYYITPNPNALFFWQVVKFDSDGNFAWKHELTDDALENRAFEILTHNSAIYIAGYTIDPSYHATGLLVKLDTAGNETWKRYSECNNSFEESILELTSSGNLLVGCTDSLHVLSPAGTSISASDTALGLYGTVAVALDNNDNVFTLHWEGYDYTIRKYNASGDLLWATDSLGYYLAFGDWQIQLTTDEAGNVYAGSIVKSETGMDSVYIYKLSPQGNIVWAKLLDYDPVSLLYRNGKLYAAGNSTNWSSGTIAIMQIDAVTANTDWIVTEGDSILSRNVDKLDIDAQDNFILASRITGMGYWDVVLAKYAGGPMGITVAEKTQRFSVYPNPATNYVVISGDMKLAEVGLYDVRGGIIGTYQLKDNTASIDVSLLSSGLYMIRVGNDVKRFVKE